MKKFVKYICSSFDNESRDKREISVVSEFNCEVIVCSLGKSEIIETTNQYINHQRENNLSKNNILRKFQIVYNYLWKYPRDLRKQRADCISCHDLKALFIGWLSTSFTKKSKKPSLIYDSHEFEIGRNTIRKRNLLVKFGIKKLEKFLMNRCEFSIVVNDSIANEIKKMHRLKNEPIVVRNIPNYWTMDENICKLKREELCEKFGIPRETFIIMYHGAIVRGRGIEKLIEVTSKTVNVVCMILGQSEKKYMQTLIQLSEEIGVSQKVIFHDAVKNDVLWQYIGAADVGMITIPPVTKSYYYMLPNKLFENIQAQTPVIASDLPEIRKIIDAYDIGLLVDPNNTNQILQAIEKMRANKDEYNRFKRNMEVAKRQLCWENEKSILKDAYAKIFS